MTRVADYAPGSSGIERITIAGQDFQLDVAATAGAREQPPAVEFSEHGGTLFVIPDSEVRVQKFWMKDCDFDIDILFLDPNGVIIATHEMKAEPRKSNESESAYTNRMSKHLYSSDKPAQFAVEIRSGWLRRLGVKPGDRVTLDTQRLRGIAR